MTPAGGRNANTPIAGLGSVPNLSLLDHLAVRRELALTSLRCRLRRSGVKLGTAGALWLVTTGGLTAISAVFGRSVSEADLSDTKAIAILVGVVLSSVAVGGIGAILGRWADSAAPPGLQVLRVLPVSRRAWGASVALPFRLGATTLAVGAAPLAVRLSGWPVAITCVPASRGIKTAGLSACSARRSSISAMPRPFVGTWCRGFGSRDQEMALVWS